MLSDPAKQQQFLKGILSPFPKSIQTFVLTTVAEFLQHVRRIMSLPSFNEQIKSTISSLWIMFVALFWSVSTSAFQFGLETAKKLSPGLVARVNESVSSGWSQVKVFVLERQEYVLMQAKEGVMSFGIRVKEEFNSRMYSFRVMVLALLKFPLQLLGLLVRKIQAFLSPIFEQLDARFGSFRLVVQDFFKIPMRLFEQAIQLISSIVSQVVAELLSRLQSVRVIIGDIAYKFGKLVREVVTWVKHTTRRFINFSIWLFNFLLAEFKQMIFSPLQFWLMKASQFINFLTMLPQFALALVIGSLYSVLAFATWASQKAVFVVEFIVSCYMALFVGSWYLITAIKDFIRNAFNWLREILIGMVTAIGALLFVSGSFLLVKIRRFIADDKSSKFDGDRLQNGDYANGRPKIDDPAYSKDSPLAAIPEEANPL